MMKETDWTITELEQKSGVSRRTIHFYIKEGLLPPPDGQGGGARYGETHLIQLALIRELQKTQLKLSGIRQALNSMTLEEKREAAKRAPSEPPAAGRERMESWIKQELLSERNQCTDSQAPEAKSFSFADLLRPPDRQRPKPPVMEQGHGFIPMQSKSPAQPTWERHLLDEGFEVLIRSDMAGKYGDLIELLKIRLNRRKGGHS